MTNKIIVADDSQTIQKVIKITFANKDYELVPCLSEEELESQITDDISLILLDFSLSESKTGYELGKSLSEKYSDIPILALLGTFDTVDEELFRNSGYSDKVVKPFETEKFISKCETLIENGAVELSGDYEEQEDIADDWGIDSPDLESSEASDSEVEETHNRRAVDNLMTPPTEDSLDSELDNWGFAGDAPTMKDVTGDFTEFPPVIEEVAIEQPFASKFLSAENLIDADDLEEVESHFDEEFTIEEAAPLEEATPVEVENEQITTEDENNFWAIDESYDAPQEYVADSSSEAADVDETDHEEEATREIDLNEFKEELYEEPQQVQGSPQTALPIDLEQQLRGDLEPLIQKYVQEYCRDHIEKVAWEIIPDLAENLIRKELKDISKTVMTSMNN